MNVKIQGGGNGTYANKGSCVAVTNYLQHEEIDRQKEGQEQEHFFNYRKEKVSAQEATYNIDKNKGQLGKNDSKFFLITVSPSQKEMKSMGKTPSERSANFKKYINDGVMERYAENFGKGLKAKDLMYYGKVHHTRNGKNGVQMHAHIIVSRKDITNKIKLSPQTNHRGESKGTVKSGFDRNKFRKDTELTFDIGFNHKRDFEESFDYQNTLKNGSAKDIKEMENLRNAHQERQEKIMEHHRGIGNERQQEERSRHLGR